MKKILLFSLILKTITSCSQQVVIVDYFKLFEGTVNEQLARNLKIKKINESEKILLSDTTVRINLQEGKNGLTLLSAAVAEDNYDAVKWLLSKGAKVDIKDYHQMAPIHLCVQDISSKKNAAIILSELLNHGANPNDEAISKHPKTNAGSKILPLMGAITDLACTKILMEHGADLYYKDSLGYPIWQGLFVVNLKNQQNFQVARFLIIEKKMPVPDTIFVTHPNKIPKFANNLVENMDTFGDAQSEKDKAEILAYLRVNG